MAEQMVGWGRERWRTLPQWSHRSKPMSHPAFTVDPRMAPALAAVRDRGPAEARVGVVLGSGLGGFAEGLAQPLCIPYADIPNLPKPRVAGHTGALHLGLVEGVPVACLSGRVHLYEGHDVADVVFGARLLAALGCHTVLLTNAAGGIRSGLGPGSLMLIVDHLNLTGRNPLAGAAHAFVDLTRAYDPEVADAARSAAREHQIPIEEGVYAGLLGPSYETPAEIRMLRVLGADAVGMSTVAEVIALRALGVRVGAVSCITNLAAGLSGAPLDHGEVQDTARRARARFEGLLGAWIPRCDGVGR